MLLVAQNQQLEQRRLAAQKNIKDKDFASYEETPESLSCFECGYKLFLGKSLI